jgi:TfoX/Sxy family transcriptional regulator of competence genes
MTYAPFTETARMRKASVAVYLATEESVADDLSSLLRGGADAIDAALAEIDRLTKQVERLKDSHIAEMPDEI